MSDGKYKRFKCPKCGGRYFGTSCDPITHLPVRIECHSNEDGSCYTFEELLARRFREPPRCGWRGVYRNDADYWVEDEGGDA